MSNAAELRERREALQAQLDALRGKKEAAFRENSDALARQRAGVTSHDDAAMKDFASNELAGDDEMGTIRRELELIDKELNAARGGRGLLGRFRK